MKALSKKAVIKCGHDGIVSVVASQQLVTVAGEPVLVQPDPQGRGIVACPNIGLSVKPCTSTLAVRTGYSGFVTVRGHAVCLDTVTGPTDGVDAQIVMYTVRRPGQTLVEVSS